MGASVSPNPSDMVSDLQRLVERGRVRWRLLILAEAVSLAIAAPLAYLWLVFGLDNLLHLPPWGLLLANVVFLACVAWAVVKLIQSWRRARFTTDQVALAIEQRTPGGLENRLINALQLSRGQGGTGAAEMTEAVVDENYRFLKQMKLQQSAESRPVVVRALIAVALVGVGVGFWIAEPERFTTSAARVFQPLAGIDPIYRTRLAVEPGDVTVRAGQDVLVQVQIEGNVPETVQLLVDHGDRQSSHDLTVDPDTATAEYRFQAVQASLTYALRGGDFRTPRFQVTVPAELRLREVAGTLNYPSYTGLGEQSVQSGSGDVEALVGTQAELTFTLNQSVPEAWLVLDPDANGGDGSERVALTPANGRGGAERFTMSHEFDRSVDYVLVAERASGDEVRTPPARLRATADEPPDVQLTGVKPDSEVMLEDVLELSLRAQDDYGLEEAGIFWRSVEASHVDVADSAELEDAERGRWQAIRTWSIDEGERTERFRADKALLLSTLAVAEGDVIELAGRARDNAPRRDGQWTTGTAYDVTVTSPGASLQLTYERILRTERQIDELIDDHEALERRASRWVANLEPDSGMRWDDQSNLDDLAAAVKELAAAQAEIRSQAGAVARGMPPEAGQNLQQGLGMLADTEMVRHIRLLERVMDRDTPQEMRSTLADARLTVRRTLRSLGEMQDSYVAFREDWELNHMISFTEMLAQRQDRLADASLAYMGLADDAMGESQRESIARRQRVVRELSELAQTAFEGMSYRSDIEQTLTEAFGVAAEAYAGSGLMDEMGEAGDRLADGDWSGAEPLQRDAAEKLTQIYRDLRAAQSEVARQALQQLTELAETHEGAEQLLEELRAGFDEDVIALQDELSIDDTQRAFDLAQQFAEEAERMEMFADDDDDPLAYEDYLSSIQRVHDDELDTEDHTLSDTFGSPPPTQQDPSDQRNPAQTVAQEHLEDIVGDLLEGTDELMDDYITYRATASWTVMDVGEVGRGTDEALSATGATATTGNQPPPPDDVGGASRMGRGGARSHGTAVGDEWINRRGLDDAQEGTENIPDHEGPPVQETMTDDPQESESTGRGGREIDSDRPNHFSTQDAGEWDDEIVEEMNEPDDVHQIVERQGEPIDPEIAERLRDTERRQEQVIERIKTVQKEFDELFLPTDHLDDIMSRLQDNLDRLREAPDDTVFREQVELLDQLRASVVVFQRPSSEFVRSVPRESRLKGQILDERAAPALPGYEDAVDRYYRRLVDLEDPR